MKQPDQALAAAREETTAAAMDRRTFLKLTGLAGGGFALAFTLGGGRRALAATAADDPAVLNAFVQVREDGRVIIYSKNPEIGQGVKTSMPMIVAEELDADWDDVEVQQSPINRAVYGRQHAGGSNSINDNWDRLRQAGAGARSMLVSAAASQWGVPAAECDAASSRVTHRPSGRQLHYADLAARAAELPVPDPDSLQFKDRREYTLLGSRITGVDNRELVTGQPLFGIDKKLPGMVYANYHKCPATGGRVRSANLEEIKSLPGVLDAFVIEGNNEVTELMPGVAIVAESTWAAFQAKKQLQVSWDESDASKDSWSAFLDKAESLTGEKGRQVVHDYGDTEGALQQADKTVNSAYTYQFLSHANMEPQNCTAWYRNGSIELWSPTQSPSRAMGVLSRATGIPEERITLHQTRVGGGFGRRLMNDYACEAAAIAMRVGKPVKVQWTREDDMQHDFYRAGGCQAMTGGLDSNGRLVAWHDHLITFTADGKEPVYGGEIRANEFPSPLVENYRVSQTMLPLKVPCGPWRSPRSNVIAWVVQSFLDELSTAAGRDHREFLLEVMGDPRWVKEGDIDTLNTGRAAEVIRLATEKAGWGRRLPRGRGMGLAFHFSHSGHFAEVAEVSVDAGKKLTVHKVTVAADIGPVINLSGAEHQCEGAVVDGLSAMLGQEITMEDGIVQQRNFNEYPTLRINQSPEVAVHFIEEGDYMPTGAGEPALPPLAPAVCNAIYAATGERVRRLPLSKHGFTI